MASRVGREPAPVPDLPEELLIPGVPPARRRTVTLLVLAGVAIAVLFAALYGYERATSSHFYPDTTIGGLDVGSRSLDEATELLHQEFVTPLRDPVTLKAPQFKKDVTPWKMGLRVDVAEAARDALDAQRAESFGVGLWHRVLGVDNDIALEPQVNGNVFERFMRNITKRLNQDPKDAWLDISKDELVVVPHQLGRTVSDKAEDSILEDLLRHDEKIEIPVKTVEPELTTGDFNRVILINTTTNRLRLYKDGEVVKKYGVATGTGGYPTPHGQWVITAKRMNPTWYNPYADWSLDMPPHIGPGPNNPLGTRALNLNASGIRIHGTPDAGSIGSNASHGCIRMHMHDVEDLFERVDVGTPVLIIG